MYPRVFREAREGLRLMCVFQNPGPPELFAKRHGGNPEMEHTIHTITPAKNREYALKNGQMWLFEDIGADKELWDRNGYFFGKTAHWTDAFKCPADDRLKESSMRSCVHYLRQELKILRPKAIVCFGRDAMSQICDCLGIDRFSGSVVRKFLGADPVIFEGEASLYPRRTIVLQAVHPAATRPGRDRLAIREFDRGMEKIFKLLERKGL